MEQALRTQFQYQLESFTDRLLIINGSRKNIGSRRSRLNHHHTHSWPRRGIYASAALAIWHQLVRPRRSPLGLMEILILVMAW